MSIILPDELDMLKDLPQWVAFRLTAGRKIPYDPKTGYGAKANDVSTWGTFDEAVAFAERHRAGGVGFEFANGIAGVDMDDVILPDGTLKPYAQEIFELMNSYTEISPSGHGLHILFRVSEQIEKLREFLGGKDGTKNSELGLELYISRHYFTVTGQVYGGVKPIAERTGEMKQVYMKYLAKSEKPTPPPVDTTKGGKKPQDGRIPSEDLSDSELFERMFNSQQGHEIQALYQGDISGYTDDWSRADLAFANYLAYWTGNDPYRMDRMFRQSGLMRTKWDERHGAHTYGQKTIAEAIRTTPTYIPPARSTKPEKSVYVPTGERAMTVNTQLWIPPMTGFDYIASGILQADLVRFQKYPDIHTGFQNFDEAQGGIFPGLYLIGATPSLGKTTLLVQVGDNIAKSGTFVLYFSLEQSRLELTTKSISRLTAQLDVRTAVSAINIRRGQYISNVQREAVEKAIAEYQKFSANISIVELGLDATITTITDTVKRFIDFTGLRPVVMVDYLQIVRPDNEKLSTKDGVDYVVKGLKKLQMENELVVMVISSFNRTNYLSPVDYESFKESGGLEYTADVLLGLQPQIMTDKLFDADKKIKEKREAIDSALSAIPRKVMLKNLKNRFGRKGYSCGFSYDPRFDLFVPDFSFRVSTDGQNAVL